jgi:hypothetical protein
MNTLTLPPNLATALVRAQTKAKAVQKDGYNEHHKFQYAKAESMIDEGRLTLSGAGLALVPTAVQLLEQSTGAGVMAPIIRETFLLLHESGEAVSFERDWFLLEGKGRPLDRVTGGALTTCLSYAIRDVLLLPRDDELAAMDRRDDREHDPRREAPAPQERTPANDAPSSPRPAPSDPFEALEQEINARGAEGCNLDAFAAAIDALPTGPAEARQSLSYLVSAWGARDLAAFAKIGAEIRKAMPKPWADITLARIRPAYDHIARGSAA